MANELEQIPSRVYLFVSMVRAAFDIDSWCLSYDKKPILLASSSSHEDVHYSFLELSGVLEYVHDQEMTRRPVIFSDQLGCVWLGEWTGADDAEYSNLLFVLGPVLYGTNTADNLKKRIAGMHFSRAVEETMLDVLKSVPCVDPSRFLSLAVMLHYCIFNEEIGMSDCILQHRKLSDRRSAEDCDSDRYPGYEQSSRATEELLLRIVREGDVETAKQYHGRKWLGKPMELSIHDSMRAQKDTLIIFIALCSRAAMDGGLAARVAKQLETEYISAVEATDLVTGLTDLSMRMFLDFTERVQKLKGYGQISREIRECCGYIQNRLLEPLELKEIAGAVGYSEYYLTRKFSAEMGMKLTDYIKQQRIEYAKILLRNTDKSVQEISDLLRFSNRNYFGTVFQAIEGVSPAAWRKGCS